MAIQYFLSLIFTVIVLAFVGWTSGFGFMWARFLDAPSAIVVIIFPLIFQGILHGWKNIGSAFSVISNKTLDKKCLLNAKSFFENYGKTVFSIAFIGFIVSFVAIIFNLEDKTALWPNIVLASILLLYAGIINMVIIIPYKTIINRKIMEMEK